MVHFTVACFVAKPWSRSEAECDLFMIQTITVFNVCFFVIMLDTRYWSLSQQGHLQPHSKSKAWQLSTQLQYGLLLGVLAKQNFFFFPFFLFFRNLTKVKQWSLQVSCNLGRKPECFQASFLQLLPLRLTCKNHCFT